MTRKKALEDGTEPQRPEALERRIVQRDANLHTATVCDRSATGDAAHGRIDAVAVDALLKGLSRRKNSVFLYTSGIWLLGNVPKGVDETAPTDQGHPMTAARKETERKVLDASTHAQRTNVIRPGDVYGGTKGLLPLYFGRAASTGVVRTLGEGRNHMPLVHRDDLAVIDAESAAG